MYISVFILYNNKGEQIITTNDFKFNVEPWKELGYNVKNFNSETNTYRLIKDKCELVISYKYDYMLISQSNNPMYDKAKKTEEDWWQSVMFTEEELNQYDKDISIYKDWCKENNISFCGVRPLTNANEGE